MASSSVQPQNEDNRADDDRHDENGQLTPSLGSLAVLSLSSLLSSASFKKSATAMIKALFLFLMMTHCYIFLFFFIPSKFYSSRAMLQKGDRAAEAAAGAAQTGTNSTHVPVNGTCAALLNNGTSTKAELKKKKKAKVVIPKEPEIIIVKEKKVVQVEQIRDALTLEQLQRIHKEEEYDPSSSTLSLSSPPKKPILSQEKLKERMTIESQSESYYKSIFDSIRKAETQVRQLQHVKDTIQNHVTKIQEEIDSNELLTQLSSLSSSSSPLKTIRKMNATPGNHKIEISALVSFLRRTSSSSQFLATDLKSNLYGPVYREIEHIIQQYQNGLISIDDFASTLDYLDIIDISSADLAQRESGNEVCDLNYLTTTLESSDNNYDDDDDDYYDDDDDEYLEDEDDDEEIMATYASHSDLSSSISNILSMFQETFSLSNFDDNKSVSTSLLPLSDNKLSILEKSLVSDLRSRLNEMIKEKESKFVELKKEASKFESKVEAIRTKNYSDVHADADVESGSCAKKDDVEYMMKHGLKNVIHNGMDVDKAMQLIIASYNEKYGGANVDDDDEYHDDALLSEDELDKLEAKPFFRELKQKGDDEGYKGDDRGKKKFKDLMNAPMVPQMIRALDEGIEMVAGYNEALDQAIDFIASLNNDDGVEEGTVGKTIETGLYHLLDKMEFPDQFYDMKKKAGILLH